ncbi:glucose/mannose transport system permease protein [Sagittula marina]|uniref:Glucose/mannose transport system permease protein n=1 Tax=Sagittula marina TaxID=943940 RepID=A0A7W6DUW6_9RHOB|nr:carbohydrate ABC transporter permease [Sagittula marina]MBB3987357.1 glucose/mannose transport system permease protein [Sagittula marina]
MATAPTSEAVTAGTGTPPPGGKTRASVNIPRIVLYVILGLFCIYYLLPLYVMLSNSLKPLNEITSGGMMALPSDWTLAAWRSAWSEAQVGVAATGLKPYFANSFFMVIPAVAIATLLGALNGYVLTKWRFRGDTILFGLILFGCFIPFQIVLIPMARALGFLNISGTVSGLIFVHVIYGVSFSTLYFRNYYAAFPTELVRAAQIDGAGFFTIFYRILLPNSGPIAVVCVIWLFTNIWNDFLFGASFSDFDSQPMTVALNNLVQSSTGVKEYNVHFAGAIMAALPTLFVYIVAGRFFVRGLMTGSVKG